MSRNPNLDFLHNAFVEGAAGAILEGSSRCFDKDQLVITDHGPVKISELSANDRVLTFNHNTGKGEYQPVLKVIPQTNVKKCYRIKMKDGTVISCTEDHLFYFQQRYNTISNILSLLKK